MSEPAKRQETDSRPVISIDEQIDEIGKQARALERFAGRLTPETRDAKLVRLYAAEATLRTIKKHADGLRSMIGWLKTQEDLSIAWEDVPDGVASILLDQPAVREVVRVFPQAVLTGSRPISALERAGLLEPLPKDPDHDEAPERADDVGAQ